MLKWLTLYFAIALEADVPIHEALIAHWASKPSCKVWQKLELDPADPYKAVHRRLVQCRWMVDRDDGETLLASSRNGQDILRLSQLENRPKSWWRLAQSRGSVGYKILHMDDYVAIWKWVSERQRWKWLCDLPTSKRLIRCLKILDAELRKPEPFINVADRLLCAPG